MKMALYYPNIDAERARHGMTVQELADFLKVSRKTYYNWCRYGRIPQNKIEELADLFNTTTDYLLGLQNRPA